MCVGVEQARERQEMCVCTLLSFPPPLPCVVRTHSSLSEPYIQSYHRLILALIACFSLSVLAAVCENNFAPGCQGSIVIHGRLS